INGFGRIGRNTLRNILLRKLDGITVAAVNDLTDTPTLAHLFKYDSVHGPYPGEVAADGDHLVVDGHPPIAIVREQDPAKLPWASLNIDVVIESTGKFTSKQHTVQHIGAGAIQVILSAPSADTEIPTSVLGENDEALDLRPSIFSKASLTTHHLAPLIKVSNKNWGILYGYI